LPNKPYHHRRQRNLPVKDPKARAILEELGADAKIVLYQGLISQFNRWRSLQPVGEAVHRLGRPWRFVVMGAADDASLQAVRQVCPEVAFIPRILPPGHLEFTSHAYIGVAAYRFDMLNEVFCAPNKIWEYAGFGIPTLCSDVPGLRFTVEIAGAGRCADLGSIPDIMRCLSEMSTDYAVYSRRSSELFDSVDLKAIVRTIIARAMEDASET